MPIIDIFNDNSCVAFWTLDGNANDLCGKYNGTWVGNEDYVDGKYGKAAHFDGNSYIQLPDGIENYFTEKTPFAITVWFMYETFSTPYSRIYDFNWYITLNHANTTNKLMLEFMPKKYIGDYTWRIKGTAPIEANKIYFCAISWDTKNLKFVVKDIDGNNISTEVISETISWNNDYPGNFIGRAAWKSASILTGFVDHLRVFNRALSDDEIEYLFNEPTSKCLFVKQDNSVWYFDLSSMSWKQVSSDKSSLTADDFKTYGNDIPLNLDFNTVPILDNNVEILFYSDTGFDYINVQKIPSEQLIVQKMPLDLQSYESINKITINTSGSGNIKFLISRDLNNWYKYDASTSTWKLVKSGALDINNNDDINLVLSEGNTKEEINSLTWNEYKKLYEVSGLDYIAFAIVLQNVNKDDNIVLESITLNVKPKPIWKDVTSKCDIYQSYKSISITFNLDGDFKVNYIDGDVSSSAESKSSSLIEIDGGSSSG